MLKIFRGFFCKYKLLRKIVIYCVDNDGKGDDNDNDEKGDDNEAENLGRI